MAADWSSVRVLCSFIRRDSCLSASWAHAGRRCLLRTWCQGGESGAHADTLSRPEMDAGESLACLSGTHILRQEAETAGAGDSARQNTKAEIGHDTWWTQMQREKLPSPPFSPLYSLSYTFSWTARFPGGGERRCLNHTGFQLTSDLHVICDSLMLPKVLKEASKKSLQSKNRGILCGKKRKEKNPCMLPEIHMLLSTPTKGQAGRQLKTTARNERRHELKGK